MKSLRDYSIPFTGLKLGKHRFDYQVTDAFFNEFEYSLVKKADLNCMVELEKQETMLILNFHIMGVIYTNCDRCLAQYPQPVDVYEQQIVKFGVQPEDEVEDIMVLTKNDHEVDISGLIYEYVNVALPFINVCNDEGNTPYCDNEMLFNLKKLAVNNEINELPDPRWDALKKINK